MILMLELQRKLEEQYNSFVKKVFYNKPIYLDYSDVIRTMIEYMENEKRLDVIEIIKKYARRIEII